MKLKPSRTAGFTLVEIMIVVTIIGLLLVIAIPNFVKNREVTARNTCLSNLRVIDTAKQLWGMETGRGSGDEPDILDLVGPGLYLKKLPECPGGGDYEFWTLGELPVCNLGGGTVHVLTVD